MKNTVSLDLLYAVADALRAVGRDGGEVRVTSQGLVEWSTGTDTGGSFHFHDAGVAMSTMRVCAAGIEFALETRSLELRWKPEL